jgi:hypothetical protein
MFKKVAAACSHDLACCQGITAGCMGLRNNVFDEMSYVRAWANVLRAVQWRPAPSWCLVHENE